MFVEVCAWFLRTLLRVWTACVCPGTFFYWIMTGKPQDSHFWTLQVFSRVNLRQRAGKKTVETWTRLFPSFFFSLSLTLFVFILWEVSQKFSHYRARTTFFGIYLQIVLDITLGIPVLPVNLNSHMEKQCTDCQSICPHVSIFFYTPVCICVGLGSSLFASASWWILLLNGHKRQLPADLPTSEAAGLFQTSHHTAGCLWRSRRSRQ